jgi:microcystin-dependent protein
MAQPTPYNRLASFTTIQAAAPTDPLPGDDVDAELNAIKTTLDEILANLEVIQRDDNELANGSVGRDQLDESIQLGFNAPTAWDNDVAYTTLDTVFVDGKFYSCIVSHTSDVFADDLADGFWELIADFQGALDTAVNVAFTPSGNISSVNVQAALEEVQADVDTLNALTIVATPAVAPSSPAVDDDSTKVATTAFVNDLVNERLAIALPAGMGPIPTLHRTEPNGWVFFNGQTLTRATYPDLWTFAAAEIAAGSVMFGPGNGTTTFTVGSIKGKVAVGTDDMGGTAAAGLMTSGGSGLDGTSIGASGGAQTHALTSAQNGTHSHSASSSVSDPGHAHSYSVAGSSGATKPAGGGSAPYDSLSGATTGTSYTGITVSTSISNSGSGSAHNNVQPSMIFNMLISCGVYVP